MMVSVPKATIKTQEEYFEIYKNDEVEVSPDQVLVTDYPRAEFRYRIVLDSFSASLEEAYFWVLNYVRYDMGFPEVEKITDVFAASEHSAFFGAAQQKLGLQQDKVSQFLATIGKMVKELFQLVRELRILDERMGYYDKSFAKDPSVAEPAEITLKGIYIDMAEGGAKSPASVYGMAHDLQFTTLPDLFFSIHPKKEDDIGRIVDALEFNKAVKNVLKRKLFTFMRWKKETHKEIKGRRMFTLRYLKQHFDIIQMYMAWVKPYLKNVKRMQMDNSKMDTPDLISAFESSLVEVEFIAKHVPPNNKQYKSIVLASFEYRTMPQMNYVQEGYQRGPLHVGEVKLTLRPYAWTETDIANYKKMREMEDLDLISTIDSSVRAAMEALGKDLSDYLQEAENSSKPKEETKKPDFPAINLFDPFVSVFKGFGEAAKAIIPTVGSGSSGKATLSPLKKKGEEKAALTAARAKTWIVYKNFKKAHRMFAW